MVGWWFTCAIQNEGSSVKTVARPHRRRAHRTVKGVYEAVGLAGADVGAYGKTA